MKKCPYCAEEIQDAAIKCKHCGERLEKAIKESPSQGAKLKEGEPSETQPPEEVISPELDEEIKRKKGAGLKQCPICGKWDVHKAYVEDMGDWCPHCDESVSVKVDSKDKAKGIGGWLLLFCLSLIVINPLISIRAIRSEIEQFEVISQSLNELPLIKIIIIIIISIELFLTIFSVVAGGLLWKKNKDAIKITKIFLLSIGGYSIIALFSPVILMPMGFSQEISGESIKDTVRTILYVLIWYSYLINSKRVKNTYG